MVRGGGASEWMFSQEKSIMNPFPLVCHRLYLKLGRVGGVTFNSNLGVKPAEKYT